MAPTIFFIFSGYFFLYIFIKNPQTRNASAFLPLSISAVGSVIQNVKKTMNFKLKNVLLYDIYRVPSARSSFWCWSRKDYNETYLRSRNIDIGFREESFESFSTNFQYNGSHVKCKSNHSWVQNWIDVSNPFVYVSAIPCVASNKRVPVASFLWSSYEKIL